jgi:hypothetical protein
MNDVNVTAATTTNQNNQGDAALAENPGLRYLHRTSLPYVVPGDRLQASSPTTVAADDLMQSPQVVGLVLASYTAGNGPPPALVLGGGQSNNYTAPEAEEVLPFQQPPLQVQVQSGVHEPAPAQEEPSTADPFDYYYYEYDEDEAEAQERSFSHEYDSYFVHDHEDEADYDLQDYAVKPKRGRELFIAHVPVDMSDEELEDLCSQFGDVVSASIKRHDLEDTQVSKCFAYVKFEQQSDADDALLRLNAYEVSMV